ncbi:MAG: hypothetical protein MZV63_66695 [Marinilabiliales bacterium]|nr:hypothetical protein [Marinilabiliales bacterium]
MSPDFLWFSGTKRAEPPDPAGSRHNEAIFPAPRFDELLKPCGKVLGVRRTMFLSVATTGARSAIH